MVKVEPSFGLRLLARLSRYNGTFTWVGAPAKSSQPGINPGDRPLAPAALLQQQYALIADGPTQQLLQQLTCISNLQQLRSGPIPAAQPLAVLQKQRPPLLSLSTLQYDSGQQANWRGARQYRTSNALNQNSCQSSGSKGPSHSQGDTRNSQGDQQQHEQQSAAGDAFIHGIHSSHEPPIHDLHHRISQIKLRRVSAAASSSTGAGGDLDRMSCGYSPDGEFDVSNSQSLSQGSDEDDALSAVNTDTSNGGLRLRFRRKAPLFQVIEFHAGGTAIEEYRERTPTELGLHPRDVTLFAPLSRLAAPQRATITVHDGKILVKTEVVKAIITPDKAILIKSRRQKDTQKIAQAILAANDQRLMANKLMQHQMDQLKDSANPIGIDSCKRAASAADLLSKHSHSMQARPGYQSNRVNYSSGTLRQSGTQQHNPAQVGYVQMLNPSSSAAANMSYPGAAQQGPGSIVEPAAVAAGGAALRRTAVCSTAGSLGSDLKDVPFEMLVLEVLLDATTEYFYTKVQHLNWMLESIAADIRQPGQVQGAIDKAHQLIPIQKFLSSLKNDIKETCAAIQTALEDDETLEDLCLSWHLQQRQHVTWSPIELQHHRAVTNGVYQGNNRVPYRPAGAANSKFVSSEQQVRMLTEMLESYEREIQSLEGSTNEAEEDLENTRSLWHMQLDSSRNHIIMVNLWLSMLNISVMATTILPAFFGMNLHSGLSETDPTVFFAVCGMSVLLSAMSYPLSRYWYNRNWRKINENELFEQKMLRVLLVQNIEDVEDIIQALRRHRHEKLDRRRFREIVVSTLGNRAMTPTHIDFLWQCFDRNRDGFLEEAELIKPLNTYHSWNTDDSSSDRKTRTAGAGAQLPQHLPRQLGSLEGIRGRAQQRGDEGGQDLGPRDPLGYSGTLRAPAGQVVGGRSRRKTDKEDSWVDDERFNWD